MKSRRELVLHALLNRCPPERKKQLERFLPEETKAHLHGAEPTKEGAKSVFFEQIHWSWLLPTLQTYSAEQQAYFLAALPPQLATPLSRQLKIAPSSLSFTEAALSYLRQILHRSLIPHESNLVPSAYLPASDLKGLLHIQKKDFIDLIQFLALDDHAQELRHIVQTTTLKRIYSFLTEKERKRLKEISSLPKNGPTSPLFLDRWEGDEESFRVLLHRKGLARLSLALRGQDPDLVWYICHQLDIGRGSTLLKLSSADTPSELSEQIVREIKELIEGYL